MITFLVEMILILSLAQDKKERMAAWVYSLIVGSHFVICAYAFGGQELPSVVANMIEVAGLSSGISGKYYFLSAGVADTTILVLLCFWIRVSRLSDLLITISLMSLVVNFTGYILWYNDKPLDPYYFSCMTLYLFAILSLIRKDRACEHGSNFINSFFRNLGKPGHALCSLLRQEAR